MRTPVRPLPDPVERWIARARLLRWLDAAAAGVVLWVALAGWPGHLPPGAAALVAGLGVGLLSFAPAARVRWRVVSAAVGLWVSRGLGVGDRAWCVGPGSAERVIVTARRGARVTVATPAGDAAEGVRVRRTRVLLVPA